MIASLSSHLLKTARLFFFGPQVTFVVFVYADAIRIVVAPVTKIIPTYTIVKQNGNFIWKEHRRSEIWFSPHFLIIMPQNLDLRSKSSSESSWTWVVLYRWFFALKCSTLTYDSSNFSNGWIRFSDERVEYV